jgi:serine/threonine protein phosphatase PrpC
VVVDFAELTNPGHDPAKQTNEDASVCTETPRGLLAVVCDGMGGHLGGQQASQAAIQAIIDHVSASPPDAAPSEVLREALENANAAVFSVGGDAAMQVRPGSTVVATLLHEAGAAVAHVGDSRMYLFRGGQIYRMTRDHSIVQQMIDAGVLTADQAMDHPDSNKITRALGMMTDVEVDVYPADLPLGRGDVFVLATDGLTDLVTDAEVQMVIQGALTEGPEALCQKFVRIALDRGGHDNITVQALFVHEVAARPVAQPTLVEGTATADASRTIAEDMAPTRVEALAPEPTLTAAPSPTLIDAPPPERTTQPGLAPAPAQPSMLPRFFEYPVAMLQRNPSGRLLFLVAAALAALIVGAVAVWWIIAPAVSRRAQNDQAATDAGAESRSKPQSDAAAAAASSARSGGDSVP